jgi:hypothetical protein
VELFAAAIALRLIALLGVNIVKNALSIFDTFAFNNLKKIFPNLQSISHFLDKDYLDDSTILPFISTSNLFKNDMAMANFCCADRLPSSPIIFISNPSK